MDLVSPSLSSFSNNSPFSRAPELRRKSLRSPRASSEVTTELIRWRQRNSSSIVSKGHTQKFCGRRVTFSSEGFIPSRRSAGTYVRKLKSLVVHNDASSGSLQQDCEKQSPKDANKSTAKRIAENYPLKTPIDVVILSNGPGEVAAWVRPTVQAIRELWGEDRDRVRISVLLAPCPHASGAELRLVRTFPEVDRCLDPSTFSSALFWGRFSSSESPSWGDETANAGVADSRDMWKESTLPESYTNVEKRNGEVADTWDWREKGVCLFLGGDQFNAILLGKRLGYKTLIYAEDSIRWACLADRYALRTPDLLPLEGKANFSIFGNFQKQLAAENGKTPEQKFVVVGDLFEASVGMEQESGRRGERRRKEGRGFERRGESIRANETPAEEGRRESREPGEESVDREKGAGDESSEPLAFTIGLLPGSKEAKLKVGVPFVLSFAQKLEERSKANVEFDKLFELSFDSVHKDASNVQPFAHSEDSHAISSGLESPREKEGREESRREEEMERREVTRGKDEGERRSEERRRGEGAAGLTSSTDVSLAVTPGNYEKRRENEREHERKSVLIRFILPLAPTTDLPSLARFAQSDKNDIIVKQGWAEGRVRTISADREAERGGKRQRDWEGERKLSPTPVAFLEALAQGLSAASDPPPPPPPPPPLSPSLPSPRPSLSSPPLTSPPPVLIEVWSRNPPYSLLQQCDLCLTTIGTNTAELGRLFIPMIVILPTQALEVFRGATGGILGILSSLPRFPFLSPLAEWMTRKVNQLLLQRERGFVAWPNRWANRMIVPELVGPTQPEQVADIVVQILLLHFSKHQKLKPESESSTPPPLSDPEISVSENTFKNAEPCLQSEKGERSEYTTEMGGNDDGGDGRVKKLENLFPLDLDRMREDLQMISRETGAKSKAFYWNNDSTHASFLNRTTEVETAQLRREDEKGQGETVLLQLSPAHRLVFEMEKLLREEKP